MRILTGIQSSGKPHLGNILGAIEPAIALSATKKGDMESIFFIADLHSLTTVKDPAERAANRRAVAAAWLACGLDPARDIIFCQSHVPEVAELTWYLTCFTPYPMLANAHSFKEKRDRLADVNAGIFTYPVLMAADILLYDVDQVPVGKDQIQHVEIAADIAGKVNRAYNREVFVVPQHIVQAEVQTVPGTDGEKMSKSRNNYIDIFADEKTLKKSVMGILSDSTALEAPKNPETDVTFALYSLLADATETEAMAQRYRAGGYGYGHAKQALLALILERFATARAAYNRYIAPASDLDDILADGASRARALAQPKLAMVRELLGF